MTEDAPAPEPAHDAFDELRSRAEFLERQLVEVQKRGEAQLLRAELKAEAIRAGMIDLDGLKLIDFSEVQFGPDGEIEGASALMARLRKAKPWLFVAPSSTSIATPPPAQAPRHKLATEMTEVEYRAAREALLKSRT